MLRRCYEPSSLRDAWLVSLIVVACLGLFVLLFGSADVEESANSSYSSAAHYQSEESNVDGSGRQTLLGVPVYDTLQGTGDRLPYQASWGQSVTWWLRLFVDWNGYGIIRAMLFAIPGLWLCIRSLQSWSPNLRLPNLIIFGLLSSSSFGLNLRQNEWSDHFVQVVGVCAVSLFLMHRRFHDEAHLDSPERLGLTFLCLAFSINGVITGHPGFWPIALAIWGAVIATFLTSDVFRTRVWAWVLTNRLAIGVTLGEIGRAHV